MLKQFYFLVYGLLIAFSSVATERTSENFLLRMDSVNIGSGTTVSSNFQLLSSLGIASGLSAGSGNYILNSGVDLTPLSTDDPDSDGVPLSTDNCPLLSNPDQIDTDANGSGNVCDIDDDGDGVIDTADAFPLDSDESVDTDNDGAGNNADTDDDNDGLLDDEEILFGTDPLNSDSDGDGASDSDEIANGRDPLINEGAIILIILGTE